MKTSGFEGRFRARDEAFKVAALVGAVRDALLAVPGMVEVADNRRVGSLLIVYDVSATNSAAVLDVLGRFLPQDSRGAAKVCRFSRPAVGFTLPGKRRMINAGLLASFVASAAGAGLHLKALHVATGIIFSAFAGIHMFDKRQTLLS
ncbi:hypothetical protein [Geobacter sp. SVR]|uniref:hypothetical protein n=1 Tax=Geobacter sp. SVR TaxID=2495594 RepID=UPI00143F0513|nr:hypothetical protein [Geobacter sp. SVR]BCS53185.1 hypothetical protein GSVR_14930 [Geobacter sp. SVR]GCF84570.1 hypothetical protein GSbR_11700 [Geobacter sp. SVR]